MTRNDEYIDILVVWSTDGPVMQTKISGVFTDHSARHSTSQCFVYWAGHAEGMTDAEFDAADDSYTLICVCPFPDTFYGE